MRNDVYWANRMKILENLLLNKDYECVRNLERQYDIAIKAVEEQLGIWYQRFASTNNITLAEARKLLSTQELKEFHWDVEEYIKYGQENAVSHAWMKQLENASARVHVSRLDSIKLQLQQQAEVLYGNQLDKIDEIIRHTYSECYYHTAFEIQRGLGVGWSLHGLTDNETKKLLSRPWTLDSQTFSDRIWANKQTLVNTVNTHLTQMIMRDAAPDETVKAIVNRFRVSKSQAGRLIMTESAAFANEARKDCFNELGVEQYTIVAALDKETCPLCGELDGKIYKMSEYKVGTTAPPFHPWCRCATAPYFADMEDLGIRAARGGNGKYYEVPKNMNYKEWYKKTFTNTGDSGIILNRNTQNTGSFSELQERMSKKHIRNIAKECGINLKGLTINIDNNEELLRFKIAGRADSENIGQITFFPNAFKNKEELVRTIYHEKCHVEQYKQHGINYVQRNRERFEEEAYKKEDEFVVSLKRKGLL